MACQADERSISREGKAGFTLIEMIAVVLILGLAMSLVVPNLSATRMGRLRDQAKQIAHRLETARQRAITTRKVHALHIDLEAGTMRIEWWVDEATAYPVPEEELDAPVEPELLDLDGPIAMSPPVGEDEDYYPIVGIFGRDAKLDEDFYFVGVDSESGWFETGSVRIGFGIDGVSEYSVIRVADAWDNKVSIEVEPLIELVRIREDEPDE